MANDQSLDRLKAKYQSVLNQMEKLGVQLKNVHLDQGKLVIRGHAKTKQLADQVWNQIKLVDANYSADLMAEFEYDAGPLTPTAERTHTVAKGDTLSALAQKFYGKASEYTRIYAANRDQLSDPDKINVGQVLKIPESNSNS